jgi:hypothetical protein
MLYGNSVKKRLSILFYFVLSIFLFAEGTDPKTVIQAWYQNNPRANLYRDIEQALIDILSAGKAASLPDILFFEILDEAAAKNILAQKVLDTLRLRLKEFLSVQTTLNQFHSCLAKELSFEEYASPAVLKKYSLLMRQGITERVVKEILTETCALHKDSESALNTLRTLGAIPSHDELPEEELIVLGKAILQSTLSSSSYTALSSFYIKGKLNNFTIHDITEIIIRVLKEGKGLIRIEQELNRNDR